MTTSRQETSDLLDALEQWIPALVDQYPARSREFAIAFRREWQRITTAAEADGTDYVRRRVLAMLAGHGVSPVEIEARSGGAVRLWPIAMAALMSFGSAAALVEDRKRPVCEHRTSMPA